MNPLFVVMKGKYISDSDVINVSKKDRKRKEKCSQMSQNFFLFPFFSLRMTFLHESFPFPFYFPLFLSPSSPPEDDCKVRYMLKIEDERKEVTVQVMKEEEVSFPDTNCELR